MPSSLTPIIALVCFLFIQILQIWRPEFLARQIRKFALAAVLLVAASLVWVSWRQYVGWLEGEATKFLLPPHQGVGYFLFYIWWRIWAPHVFSLVAGALLAFLAYWYDRRHNRQFFYAEEFSYIFLATFLVGHPQWLFYWLSLIAAVVIFIGLRHLIWGWREKTSLYYFWVPVAAFVILINEWLIKMALYGAAKV